MFSSDKKYSKAFVCLMNAPIGKSRLAADAANVVRARRQYWQRALPISSPPAAFTKTAFFFPQKCLYIPQNRHFFPSSRHILF